MEIAFTGEEVKKRTQRPGGWSEGEIQAELKKFDDKIQDCKEHNGEIEVRDAIVDKAEFYQYEARNYVEAEKIYREAYKMTGGASRKMEILFEILLMNIEKEDIASISKDIDTCHKLIDEGADWDKKNKLKIYEGVYLMLIRDFKKASVNFVSSIATFTAAEVMPFKEFVFYAVVLALLT